MKKKLNLDPILISELIHKSILGKLSVAEEHQLATWLNASEKNKEIYEQYQNEEKLDQDLQFFFDVDMGASWGRMKQKISREGQVGSIHKPKNLFLFKVVKIGAAAAVLLFAGWMAFLALRTPSDLGIVKDTTGLYQNDVLPGDFQALLTCADGSKVQLKGKEGYASKFVPTAADAHEAMVFQTLSVPKGGTFAIMLADGTKVFMNSDSKLEFPVSFRGAKREVKLTGEAYFEVAKNKHLPFVIAVGGSRIEVLGTQFNVNPTGDGIKTTLVEGSVKLISAKGTGAVLKPGELGTMGSDGITTEKADLRKTLAWKNNEFYFRDDSFADVLKQLALWYDLDVTIEKGMSDMLISGGIDKDVKLSETLTMLKYITNASFKVEGRKLTVMK